MRRESSEAGFTLIEAVIAALILMVAIVFVAQLFVTAMKQNQTSRQYTHATAMAQSKLEELNAMPIGQLQYGGDLGPKTVDGRASGDKAFRDFVASSDGDAGDKVGVVKDRDKADYVRYWKIEPDPGGWQGMYRISVRVVALSPGRGVGEEVTLSTVRSQF
jgi:type II secretory pathway pseudopilin PulG